MPRSPKPKPAAKAKASRPGELYGIRFTHPDRVIYADVGVTKRDLAEYCAAVAEWMLPHMVHRPLTLVRCPSGMGKPCFYQKQPMQGLPDCVKRLPIRFKEEQTVGVYIEDLCGLIALIQFGVLEIHAWQSSVDNIERPDQMIFDLDPGPDVAWSKVVAAALLLRDSLKELGLTSFVKTTGGKGLHIAVPIEPKRPWSEIKEFTRSMAEALVVADPRSYTVSMSKAARPGKIFVDYLRNERGSTAVVAYSPRARAGAPVSLPLDWRELKKTQAGNSATVLDVPTRMKKRKTDPWAELLSTRQSISNEALRAVASIRSQTTQQSHKIKPS